MTLLCTKAGDSSTLQPDLDMWRGGPATGEPGSPEWTFPNKCWRLPGAAIQQSSSSKAMPGSFDAVVANFGILHLGRPERAAAGFARVLKPGGRAALTAWDYPQQCPMVGVITEAVRASGVVAPPSLPAGPDFFRFASESELSTLLREAGLRDIRVRTLSFEHRISSADALWRGFAEGGVRNRALLMLQPEDVRRRIHGEFTRRLEPFRSGEGFKLPVSIKLASGSKAAGEAQ